MPEITNTELAARLSEATDLFEGANGRILAHEQALSDTFNGNQNRMSTSFYIDQNAGDDANDGREDSPIMSIPEAIRRTPKAGMCTVRLLTDYHIANASIRVDRVDLYISGTNNIQRNLTHESYKGRVGITDYQRVHGFLILGHGVVSMSNINWIMPEDPPGAGDLSKYAEGLINESARVRSLIVKCRSGRITRSATAKFRVTRTTLPLMLDVVSVTFPDQPMLGYWSGRHTDTNGTDTTTIPNLITSLNRI